MNKTLKKTAVTLTVLPIVSANGYSTVYGYGGGRSGSRRTTPVVTNANLSGGAVLGASTVAFNSNLSQGMQSEEVRQLQERLRAEGFFTFHTSTGYFGPITLAAVKAYQQAKGISPVSGFVGPLTRAELNK